MSAFTDHVSAHGGVPLSPNGHQTIRAPLALYSIADLRAIPPVTWLIDGLLVSNGFAVLYGPSGVGKSFVALDWSCTVADGSPWCDQRATIGGWVLYIAAEGAAGLAKRIDAWCADRQRPEPERIRFLPDAVNLLDPSTVTALGLAIASMPEPPALIVIDTLARTLIGGDENSAKDISAFVSAVDQLRAQAGGCTTLVLHHTGKKGDDERGSSATRGASDQMSALTIDTGGRLRLEHTKLKDFDEPAPIRLTLATVDDSCVVRPAESSNHAEDSSARLGHREHQVLELLLTGFGDDWASRTRLHNSLSIPESSLDKILKYLHENGFIDQEKRGVPRFYRITDRGRATQSSRVLSSPHEDSRTVLAAPAPLGAASDEENGDE